MLYLIRSALPVYLSLLQRSTLYSSESAKNPYLSSIVGLFIKTLDALGYKRMVSSAALVTKKSWENAAYFPTLASASKSSEFALFI